MDELLPYDSEELSEEELEKMIKRITEKIDSISENEF